MKNIYYIPISGRPNAGKTSIVNFLTSNSFPVGKKAGTTKRIREVIVTENLTVIDLPGYGKIFGASRKEQEEVKDSIVKFIEEKSKNFVLAIHVIDSKSLIEVSTSLDRKGIIPIDIEMINFLVEMTQSLNLVILVCLNKIDRLKKKELEDVEAYLDQYNLQNIEIVKISKKLPQSMKLLKGKVKEIVIKRLGKEYHNF